MTTRRSFIKYLFSCWGMLLSCRMQALVRPENKRAPTEPVVPDEPGTAEAIILTPGKGTEVDVLCRFARTRVEALDIHPLQGLLLCAVEAHNQIPRCVPLFGKENNMSILQEQRQGFYFYRFKVDVARVLSLGNPNGIFYIHLSIRQLRSAVLVYPHRKRPGNDA